MQDVTNDNPLRNKRILLGVSGGIAAYKAPMLVRALHQAGAEVQVVLTAGAEHFVTATTLQAVSGRSVRTDLWDAAAEAAMGHIELARWADAVVIAPATAHCIAQLANGLAGDLLSTLYLASTAPKFIAPAMNQAMWHAPATQRNVQRLREDGVQLLGPDSGDQACGDVGPGRMQEPDAIVAALGRADLSVPSRAMVGLEPATRNTTQNSTTATDANLALQGAHVVITAGPTQEAIDPVRYISNHSSGKQGYAIAAAAHAAGAHVTLVSGPVSLECPVGVTRVWVNSAREMLQAVETALPADVFLGVAAVADYRPSNAQTQKIKKEGGGDGLQLNLVENPDIIATVARSGRANFVVGFAAETHNSLEYARAKRERKGLDLIVVNDVSDTTIGFGADVNGVTLIWDGGERSLPVQAKSQVAEAIVSEVAARSVDKLAPANPQPAVS